MEEDLTQKVCVACEGGLPPLRPERVQEFLKQLKTPWQVKDENQSIRKEYTFKNFKDALDFVNKVGALAESEGHHPDLQLSWGKVVIELTTHALKGLSENDFILAAKIEALVLGIK